MVRLLILAFAFGLILMSAPLLAVGMLIFVLVFGRSR